MGSRPPRKTKTNRYGNSVKRNSFLFTADAVSINLNYKSLKVGNTRLEYSNNIQKQVEMMFGGEEIIMGQTANDRMDELPRRVSHKMWEWIKKTPEAPALQESNRSWTYAELGLAANTAKEFLQKHEIRGGDRLILVCENSCLAAAFLIAASDLNVWVVPVNARMSASELDAIINDCQPRKIIFTTAVSNEARNHAKRHSATFSTNDMWGDFAFSSTLESNPEPVLEDDPEQVLVMIYTSGTTGKPKGVMLTHKNMGYVCLISGGIRGMEPNHHIYSVLPISHIFGLASGLISPLFYGASAYLEPKFDPQVCLNTLLEQKITMFMGVPPMYSALIQASKGRGLSANNLFLTYLSIGGSPLDFETKSSIEAFFNLPLHNGFGLTETSPTLTQTRLNEGLENCSVGRPIPGTEIKLIKDDGSIAPVGDIGELWVRGPQVMKGYFRNLEQTQKVLDSEGWFNTGDVAQQDEYGNISIVGRTKEMIVRSGFNVYPAEVEAVLNAHPQISLSAVVGVKLSTNEDVYAYIQTIPGSEITEKDIEKYCKQNLTPYKRPSKITIMPALPASNTGKLLKAKLQNLALDSIEGV